MPDARTDVDLETLLLLRAARETGALEALVTSADTAADVAAETDVTERAAAVVVAVLEAEGFLERVDGVVEPTTRALGFLAKTDVRSIGSLPARLDRLDRGLALPETMRSGDVPAVTPTERRNRLGEAGAIDEATVRAVVTAALRFAPDAGRVVDVGGAPGRYALEFAARGLEGTLYDRPPRIDASRALLAGSDVSLREGPIPDLRLGSLSPSGAGASTDPDLLVAVDLAHRLGPDRNRRLLEVATAALEPGSWIVLVDRVWGRSPGASRAAVRALYETDSGRVDDEDRFRTWFDEAGLEGVRLDGVPGTDRQAIGGRVPDS